MSVGEIVIAFGLLVIMLLLAGVLDHLYAIRRAADKWRANAEVEEAKAAARRHLA